MLAIAKSVFENFIILVTKFVIADITFTNFVLAKLVITKLVITKFLIKKFVSKNFLDIFIFIK